MVPSGANSMIACDREIAAMVADSVSAARLSVKNFICVHLLLSSVPQSPTMPSSD